MQCMARTPVWLRPAATIFGIYICPVALLATGIIPFAWRFGVLIAMTLLAAAIAAASRRHTVRGLGLGLPRAGQLLRWALVPSAILIAAIALGALPAHHAVSGPASGRIAFYVFFVCVSAPAQEFLYRGFLFAELGQIRLPPAAMVLVSAALFGFMHIIYRDRNTVLLTLAAGLVWAMVFQMTRRVSITAVSHAVLGVAAIMTGVI